jgi:PncC family amidohydrolase
MVMEERLVSLLMEKGLTVTTAESCTGGMIASQIVNVSGASEIFHAGFVTYANSAKEAYAGVLSETLQTYGAVSSQVALEMARGVAKTAGADVGISVTGIAGPGGGTAEKPVGTVCFGVADKFGCVTSTEHFGSMKDRGKIRRFTTSTAFMKLIKRISENYRT